MKSHSITRVYAAAVQYRCTAGKHCAAAPEFVCWYLRKKDEGFLRASRLACQKHAQEFAQRFQVEMPQ